MKQKLCIFSPTFSLLWLPSQKKQSWLQMRGGESEVALLSHFCLHLHWKEQIVVHYTLLL
jgi:hypothetical protein